MKPVLAVMLFLVFAFAKAQQTNIKGKILDSETKEPLSGVAVYLSGTSTGVASGLDGSFSIDYDQEMNAPLVFSYLGYEKKQFANPLNTDLSVVLLKQRENELEAVVINPDPWDRATKEELFIIYFLGIRSREDCVIHNMKDIRMRFNPEAKQMTAVSRNPIVITNKHLGYTISYDMAEFEINFDKINLSPGHGIERTYNAEHARRNYIVKNSFGAGTSFYREMNGKRPNSKRRKRRRENAYKLSQLKLYRSFIHETMNDNKFELFHRGFRVKPEDHIRVRQEGDIYKVTFRHLKYSVRDRDEHQSDLFLTSNFLYFDSYGNIINSRDLMLSGYIPQLGVGGMMPLDYDMNESE